ncbi:CerR family C-terminal domain-containing protein [uncultured Stenotrophomonas sp.]|uniref:TetR/AcrR family transcriptional regulator n=1 Tax=uncultured Stenotrophomonas sp. TaxID=165438 RepID=UPI00260035A8|nr:CerR family C-terminal domain-containing protein [uncultured Stenotrophomonas sp.]
MSTQKTTPRGPRTDGEATRARLLEAAGQLFSQQGFAETTSKAVAQLAAADLASINYHFGSRNGLYQAVLLEAHRQLLDLDDLQRIAGSALNPEQRLYELLAGLVQRAQQPEAWAPRVLARELLAPSSHLQVLMEEAVPPKMMAVAHILSEISGIPANEPALLRCLLSVAAPCMMLIVIGRDVPGPLQAVVQGPSQPLLAHLHRFAIAGLQAVGEGYRSKPAAENVGAV